MIFEQYTYPFSTTEDGYIFFRKPNTVVERRRYRQIGIEHPHSIPIFKFNEYKNFYNEETNAIGDEIQLNDNAWSDPIIVYIDPIDESIDIKWAETPNPNSTGIDKTNHDFCLFEKDIYEVNLYGTVSAIMIKIPETEKNNPYLIINAAYEIAD